ncbi:pyruvate formate-lyase-activating protein [Haloferula sp.]|uniref:pyruvate formate-lyase-activating protein n=1 Tax=Haloferula sp. TaxID=2497595 RepID=UPI003C7572EC
MPSLTQPTTTPPCEVVGQVHSIETMGTVDGPGLRYVLFLAGCPLRCQYCHNSDAQGPPIGTPTTPGAAIADIIRYKAFIKSGGLTISGGEPLLQPDFVRELFKLAKEHELHTTLDTSGFLGAAADDELLEHTDLVLLDIKSGDPAVYKRTTGVDLEPTLTFARRLDEKGVPVWLRFVLVPGLTDAEANVEKVAEFAATLSNVERIQILPFHKMGEHKFETAGKAYKLANTPSPTDDQVQAAREIFKRHGLTAE